MLVPIQVASQRSGVTAHVIRIWERRYGALEPVRTGTNRRLYGDEQIRRLQLLRQLTECGHRIGNIATLGLLELARLLQDGGTTVSKATPREPMPPCESAPQYLEACLQAVTDFDSDGLRQLLHRSRIQLGQRCLLVRVIAPFIQELGRRWQDGSVRTGQEHLGTAVVREVLLAPPPGHQPRPGSPEIIVSTPAGELHEIGALLAAATARDLGWQVTYLGPNLAPEEIAACARARQARAVALSLVCPEQPDSMLQQIQELRQLLQPHCVLIVGGRASSPCRQALENLPVHWVTDLPALDDLLIRLEHDLEPTRSTPWTRRIAD
ncbi:MAG: MerR family transcriptional regulator [Verrucomicrobiales bacterium]|nr:MerR family transcriptional regulator [Verrucomicrobiales bacterium]